MNLNVSAIRALSYPASTLGRRTIRVVMTLPVEHNAVASRFEARPGGQLALCSYRLQGNVAVFHHTEVPWQLQGQGVADALVRAALAWARQQRLRVRPTCSYVAAWMRRHPESHDLLEEQPGDQTP